MSERNELMKEGKETPRMLPVPVLLAAALVAVVVLAWLIPSRSSIQAHVEEAPVDRLSLTYLELAVAENPDDPELRYRLARLYYVLSRYDSALATLAPMTMTTTAASQGSQGAAQGDLDTRATLLAYKARMLAIEIQHARCTTVPGAGSGAGQAVGLEAGNNPPNPCSRALVDHIRGLVASHHPMPSDERHPLEGGHSASKSNLGRLADIALAHGAPGLAAELYERVSITESGDERIHVSQKAISAYLRAGYPEKAAAVHARLSRGQQHEQTIQHIEHAVGILRAWQRPNEALALVLAELDRLPSSEYLLHKATDLALAGGRPDEAARLGRRLLALHPTDPDMLARQLSAELAAGELEHALVLAQRLVALTPHEPHAHEQLAQIAEWVGRPLLAMDEWAWLSRGSADPRYRERASALAQIYWDRELLLELILRAARTQPLGPEGQLELAQLHLALGQPLQARTLLERMTATWPAFRPAWDALLATHLTAFDLDGAAATWAGIHAQFGTSAAEARVWAELLWRADRPEGALAVVEASMTAFSPDSLGCLAPVPLAAGGRAAKRLDSESLHMAAELAWQLERVDTARHALHALWRCDQASAAESERLMILLRMAGQIEQAVEIGLGRWQRERTPMLLVHTMQMAADAGRWDLVSALVSKAGTDAALTGRSEYWRLRVAMHQRRLRQAIERRDEHRIQDALAVLRRDLAAWSQRVAGAASEHLVAEMAALQDQLDRQELTLAAGRRDVARIEALLGASPALRTAPEPWRVLLEIEHERLGAALGVRDLAAATASLAQADTLLARAAAHGAVARANDRALRDDMYRQVFYAAMDMGEMTVVEHVLELVELPAVDRIRALERLGRYEQAAIVAMDAHHAPSDSESRAAPDVAGALESVTGKLPRHVGGYTRALVLGDLQSLEAGAAARYAWDRLAVSGHLAGRRLEPRGMSTEDITHELSLWLIAHLRSPTSSTELATGWSVREGDAVPAMAAAHDRRLGPHVAMRIDGGMRKVVEESGVLLRMAVRDHAAMSMTATLGEHLILGSRIAGLAYRARDGGRLATGLELESSIGYRSVHARQRWNMRLVGAASWRRCTQLVCADEPLRLCEGDTCALAQLMDTDTRLVGMSMGLGGGGSSHMAVSAEPWRYSLELMSGWLAPEGRLVGSAAMELGFRLGTSGELALTAEWTSGLESMSLGTDRRLVMMLQYAHTLWR